MKEIATNIDFGDSSYKFCEASEDNLIIYIDSWDGKVIKIILMNVIQFVYRIGSVIKGLYEENEASHLLQEALSLYYEKKPNSHNFKAFYLVDIDDRFVFEVIAEEATISKES